MNAVILGFGELALLGRGQEQKVDKEEEGPAEPGSATSACRPRLSCFSTLRFLCQ